MEKISDKWKKKLLSILIVLLSCYLLLDTLILSDSDQRCDPDPSEQSYLTVDDTVPVKTGENNTSVSITCDIFLTNSGTKTSGDVKIVAYVMEDNFAICKEAKTVGKIKNDSTGLIEMPLTLSDVDNGSSYDIKILLFENDRLTIRGGLRISAHPRYTLDELDSGKTQEYSVDAGVPNFQKVH